jgi:hypothetical protein
MIFYDHTGVDPDFQQGNRFRGGGGGGGNLFVGALTMAPFFSVRKVNR